MSEPDPTASRPPPPTGPPHRLLHMMKVIAACIAVGVVLNGCDSFPANNQIGARQIGDHVEVQYGTCLEEKVKWLEVRGNYRNDYEDWDVLWRIEADPPVERSSFVIGTAPPEFVEEVRLTTELPEDAYLALDTTLVSVGVGVGKGDLPDDENEVVTGNYEVLALKEFQDRNRQECISLKARRETSPMERLLPTIVPLAVLAAIAIAIRRSLRRRKSSSKRPPPVA